MRRALVVEDDPDIAQLVARYLDKAGFTTERVASGRDALHPATTGADMLVPLRLRYGLVAVRSEPLRSEVVFVAYIRLSGSLSDAVPTPGATMSGFAS